jgi:hypothetical protein
MARICHLSSQWKWEAISHGEDAYLVSFPIVEDLKRVDGFQMGVPDSTAQMSTSIWKTLDVPHKFELQQVWMHVDGVPHTVRHFLVLWAVGSLIGTTLDVDLVSIRSLVVVRILVAMMEPKNLDKMNEVQGYACLGVSMTVKLKSYDFFFHREQQDFVPDKGFTPFFWKRKGDDTGNDGPGQDNDGIGMMHPLMMWRRRHLAWTLTNRKVDILLLLASLFLLVRVMVLLLHVSLLLPLLTQI